MCYTQKSFRHTCNDVRIRRIDECHCQQIAIQESIKGHELGRRRVSSREVRDEIVLQRWCDSKTENADGNGYPDNDEQEDGKKLQAYICNAN